MFHSYDWYKMAVTFGLPQRILNFVYFGQIWWEIAVGQWEEFGTSGSNPTFSTYQLCYPVKITKCHLVSVSWVCCVGKMTIKCDPLGVS